MMELKDFIYVASFVFMLIGGLISLVGVKFQMENKVNLLAQDIENEKKQTKELKTRLEEHEDKIEKKLDDIVAKITELTIAIKKN